MNLYVIKRKSTNEFYKGGYPLKKCNRWSTNLEDAKIYKKERFAKCAIANLSLEEHVFKEFFEIIKVYIGIYVKKNTDNENR